MIDKKCCFKPYGTLYMAELPDTCPTPLNLSQYGLLEVGNVTEITRNLAFNELTIPNLQTSAFGNACEYKVLDAETINIIFSCVKTENLRIALGGNRTEHTGVVQTDEEHTVPADAGCFFIPTNFLINTELAVTVTDAGGVITYVLGTDYFIKSSGILLTENTTIDNQLVEITYTSQDQTEIDPSDLKGREYILHFDGNNAVNGDALAFTYYRVKFDPAETLPLLSEDFLTLAVTGEALISQCHFDNAGNGLRSTFDITD